jgi:hypothetical protein
MTLVIFSKVLVLVVPHINRRGNSVPSLVLLSNQGVCHTCGLAIYIKKYLKAKEEELWKLKYNFTMPKKKSSKNPLKETKILQDIITL